MRHVRVVLLAVTLLTSGAGLAATNLRADEACCMYDVCDPIWGDGCYGALCTCTEIPISCCAAGRPCAGGEF